MRITQIETFTYWISWCNWLFVKVSTEEELYGWGEGSLSQVSQVIPIEYHK